MAYTDGSKAEGLAAEGVFSEGPCGSRPNSYGDYLGDTASIADAERLAMTLAMEREPGMLAILSDSKAAIATAHRLANGATPRSDIERRMKDCLTAGEREIGVAWVRSHIGIGGNERADRQAPLERIRGETRGSIPNTTFEGLKELRKALRKEARSQAGYGRHRTDWGKHALAAYTWARTNKGPQNAWLHHIGKAEDPSYPAATHPKTGTT